MTTSIATPLRRHTWYARKGAPKMKARPERLGGPCLVGITRDELCDPAGARRAGRTHDGAARWHWTVGNVRMVIEVARRGGRYDGRRFLGGSPRRYSVYCVDVRTDRRLGRDAATGTAAGARRLLQEMAWPLILEPGSLVILTPIGAKGRCAGFLAPRTPAPGRRMVAYQLWLDERDACGSQAFGGMVDTDQVAFLAPPDEALELLVSMRRDCREAWG